MDRDKIMLVELISQMGINEFIWKINHLKPCKECKTEPCMHCEFIRLTNIFVRLAAKQGFTATIKKLQDEYKQHVMQQMYYIKYPEEKAIQYEKPKPELKEQKHYDHTAFDHLYPRKESLPGGKELSTGDLMRILGAKFFMEK